ncbi:hemerythrin domain-containing protein [Pseudomonadota bacterium]
MKRVSEFRALSSDHHRALVFARKAYKFDAKDDADLCRFWGDVELYFRRELVPHFEIEELYLGRQLKSMGHVVLAERLIDEHHELASFFFQKSNRTEVELHCFGKLLEKHVRFEERELFELAQKWLTSDDLSALAQAYYK